MMRCFAVTLVARAGCRKVAIAGISFGCCAPHQLPDSSNINVDLPYSLERVSLAADTLPAPISVLYAVHHNRRLISRREMSRLRPPVQFDSRKNRDKSSNNTLNIPLAQETATLGPANGPLSLIGSQGWDRLQSFNL
ncbi:hypothetical protein HRR83_000032 [Exophiala dermatitidis]|uniref:Uncharacterized protein n=1 Tax=Exophiala dermatitidis TaxID=5970 RepID=A0AAN6F0K8_EXODE|nr:hypothetical protein HRR73_002566 [Exophiala dermatitidis]KAJ4527281.1 hypothetical protein HRR74_000033 [Exophiala dermatitidis]KAJ4530834.1 hypothetical protein HRR76_008528 [Exophiala dermatitidis]KAJ4558006.1 hypothetical protein HRR77_000033 [Exophiala dermatitidis]KAJ4581965.1 hypothetical protein HRR79_000965 [Exophiala dermatitidis]